MKAVFILFDSLNRHMLGAYGGNRIPTPNFDRLAQLSAKYNRHYVGSMPCMPARRDMLTGRLSFLHRSWGPIEPFDNAFPEHLQDAGIYSHLVTDHYHYWEDGGATYHNRYDSYEFVRGQEGDSWKAMVQPPWERLREKYHEHQFATERRRRNRTKNFGQDIINREFIKEEEDFPSFKCFQHGFEFLDENKDADNWFLQIETFDPHEPFFAPERFKRPFDTGWNGPTFDWPRYGRVDELPAECDELRANYYSVVAMCDHLLGDLLNYFDKYDMWKDTALIVTTDHGFLLGEHDFWAKNRMNIYQEIANIPLFIHDPRQMTLDGTESNRLTQNIDLAPTILELFGVQSPVEVQGEALLDQSMAAENMRKGALFGYFGGAVHLTDGRHTYHRYPHDIDRQEIYQYTLMPTHLAHPFSPEELSEMVAVEPLGFTKGARMMKIPMNNRSPIFNKYGPGSLLERETRLYDLSVDPGQESPLDDQNLETGMAALMTRLMAANEAPPEAYERLSLNIP